MAELDDMWKKWKAADDPREEEEYLYSMLDEAEPIIDSAIQSYAGGHDDAPVNLAAKRAAVDAFENYDSSKGASLSTHLQNTLQKITNTVKKRSQTLYAPRIVEANLRVYRDADRDLREDLGRSPSTGEISEHTGLSRKRIEQLKKFDRNEIPDSALHDQDITDVLGVETTQESPGVWVEAVYTDLSGRDQAIYDKLTGSHGEEQVSKGEVAEEFNISKPRVSQIVNRILSKLKEGNR